MECAVDWRIKVSAFVMKMELSQKPKLSIYRSSFGLTLPREVILLIQRGRERSGLQVPGDAPDRVSLCGKRKESLGLFA